MAERDDDKLTIIGGYVVNTPSADELARLRAVEAAAHALFHEIDTNDPTGPEAGMDRATLDRLDALRAALADKEKGRG